MANKYFEEFVDPFQKGSFIIRAEHYMRYQFACMFLKKHMPKGSIVFDIGSGNGYGSRMLKKAGFFPIGFDKTAEFLHEANRLSTKIPYHHVDFDEMNIVQYAEKNRIPKPDAVVCFEILEHLSFPESFLKQLANLMNNQAILILSVPNEKFEPKKHGKPRNIFHKQLFTKEALEDLVNNAGFTVQGFYGQPYTNVLLHKARPLIKVLDRLSDHSLSLFKLFAALAAKPEENKITSSYSFIVVARKKEG